MSHDKRHQTIASPIVFLVDCCDSNPVSSALSIELKKKPTLNAVYHRSMIDSCLEGISEYERLVRDISLEPIELPVVCTGLNPHIHHPYQNKDLGPCSDLTLAGWQQSIALACQSLRNGDRIVIMMRYQRGIHDTEIKLDDVESPVSIFESVQNAVLALGRETHIKLTIIRVVMDQIETDLSCFSSSCTIMAPFSLSDAFPIAVETFVVHFDNIFTACWELAQRHLDLRSINISGIPMKKSRKQANIGKRFSVSFLYPNPEQNELDRIQDQNEISHGLIQLGSSSWLTRRSKDVFWSHAPENFDFFRTMFASIQIVTPSNLSSPLTAPLMKAVLVPNSYLFFSNKEDEPPRLIMGLHGNRLYLHDVVPAPVAQPVLNETVIPDEVQSFVQQFDLIAKIMTVRSSCVNESHSTRLRRRLGSLLDPKQVVLNSSWRNCRLQTIVSTCIHTMLKPDLQRSEIQDLSVAIDALRDASISRDATFLPHTISAAVIPAVYESMWTMLSVVAATVDLWSDVHRAAANIIGKVRHVSVINARSGAKPKQTLMDAFWNTEYGKISLPLSTTEGFSKLQ